MRCVGVLHDLAYACLRRRQQELSRAAVEGCPVGEEEEAMTRVTLMGSLELWPLRVGVN